MSALVVSYGSNLWTPRLLSRCPGAVEVDDLVLRGTRLIFARPRGAGGTGTATVVASRGGIVRAVLHEVGSADLARLDAAEGAGHVYVRSRFPAGQGRVGWIYLMRDPSPTPPSPHYLGYVAAGYRERGWDLSVLGGGA